MKRLALVLGMIGLLAAVLPGCCNTNRCPDQGLFKGHAAKGCRDGICRGCGKFPALRGQLFCSHCCRWSQGVDETAAYNGPPSAAVAYPYYTVRGPRDFLNPGPPTIGP